MSTTDYICPHCRHKFLLNKSALKGSGDITCPVCKKCPLIPAEEADEAQDDGDKEG